MLGSALEKIRLWASKGRSCAGSKGVGQKNKKVESPRVNKAV